jgi:hypothetical protein
MENIERKGIRHLLINGEGKREDRVLDYIKSRVRTNDIYWVILIGLICIIFTGFYIAKDCPNNKVELKGYKRELDSIYSYKIDSCITFANQVPNDVLKHFGKDTIK